MIILYPTETVYGLGVNAFDREALAALYALKKREPEKAVSWLVRDIADIEHYAEVSQVAAKIAERFLPGPLTLVLPLKDAAVPEFLRDAKTIGFRISSDPVAQNVVTEFMQKYHAPLTTTSANVSGESTLATVVEILRQFGENQKVIEKIYDAGPRCGQTSTVVSVIGDTIACLREGAVPFSEIIK